MGIRDHRSPVPDPRSPGWSAKELLDELLTRTVRIVAFDFPLSIPDALLRDEKFAANAGYKRGAFIGWRTFDAFVAERLLLGEPLDFHPFDAWRSGSDRACPWARRATDIVAGGQPPLKDKFQATFQMTLPGNAVLSRLWESRRYRMPPFPDGGTGEVIEVYLGATLRQMGLANYKSRPEEAIRLGIAACTAAGITLDVDPRLRALPPLQLGQNDSGLRRCGCVHCTLYGDPPRRRDVPIGRSPGLDGGR